MCVILMFKEKNNEIIFQPRYLRQIVILSILFFLLHLEIDRLVHNSIDIQVAILTGSFGLYIASEFICGGIILGITISELGESIFSLRQMTDMSAIGEIYRQLGKYDIATK